MEKQDIIIHIENLLKLAESRSTKQGVLVYENILSKLKNENNVQKIQEMLIILNRTLSGIEAHGYFTNDEYQHVKELRNLEKKLEV
jgi:hypothetical protein